MTHINQRRDYAANWTSANPVLQLGEVGWERDTRKAKLGDGVTPWNSLPYAVEGTSFTINGEGPDSSNNFAIDKNDIGLGNVNNTADSEKPVSIPQAAAIQQAIADAKLAAHPVGSIYMSVDPANPGTILGGTWVAWGAGRMPVGFNSADTSFDTVEETGGSKTVTLVEANLPPHTHGIGHTHEVVSRRDSTAFGNAQSAARPSVTGTIENVNTTGPSTTVSGNGNGTSTPVNNLPPYITVHMWKRTA